MRATNGPSSVWPRGSVVVVLPFVLVQRTIAERAFRGRFAGKGRGGPRSLALEYLGSPVRFDLTADVDGGTELRLTHEGVRAEEWIETHAGWSNVLFPLEAYVVHGVYLRNGAAGRSWEHGYVDG